MPFTEDIEDELGEESPPDRLATAPTLLRAPIARGLSAALAADQRVDPKGGMYKAGIIYGAAVITRGEALGHDMWIDKTFLTEVALAIATAEPGTKSRFTHPSLSGDGLGKALGRFRDASLDDDVVRADLHMYQSAHKTPDGDLAGYIMDRANEDPASFGVSIAFDGDRDAESAFMADHKDKGGRFVSPDPDNEHNFPHARLALLAAADVVDDPAANPDGLFHRGDRLVFDGEAMLAYVLGLSSKAPAAMFGMHPDRLRGFVARFLTRNGLHVGRATGPDAVWSGKELRRLLRGRLE